MQYIKQFLSYLCPKYINNTRFVASFMGYTKLFYERSVKNFHIFSEVGNLFKGSKWLDYFSANTKLSITTNYKKLILLLCTFYFFSSILDILSAGTLTVSYWEYISQASNYVTSLYIDYLFYGSCLLSHWIPRHVDDKFSLLLSRGCWANFTNLRVVYPLTKWDLQNARSLDSVPRDLKFYKFWPPLYKPQPSTLSTNLHNSTKSFTSSTLRTNRHRTPTDFTWNNEYVPGVVLYNYLSDSDYHVLNSPWVSFVTNPDKRYQSLMLQSVDSLSDGKKFRWLVKNSSLSACLDRSNNSYVGAKSITDFGGSNLSNSNSNIWQSTFYSGNNIDIPSNRSAYQMIQDQARNYNLFEEARSSFSGRSAHFSKCEFLNTGYICLDLEPIPEFDALLSDNDKRLQVCNEALYEARSIISSILNDSSLSSQEKIDKIRSSGLGNYAKVPLDPGFGLSNSRKLMDLASTHYRSFKSSKNDY